MAQVAGTTWTKSVAGSITMDTNIREDLEDVIWLLDPMDTWALSNLDKVEAENVYHEWLSDTLAAAAANRQVEGDDASFATAQGGLRLGNYCQISRKTFLVSGTVEASKKAGRKSEIARLGVKLMKELKRDMESSLITNQASSVGGATTARSLASMESWITTSDNSGNGVRATTTASASTTGFSGGVVGSPTDGTTTGALTEVNLKLSLANAWADGGDPRVILAGSTQKTAIDAFTGIATRFVDASPTKQAAIVGAANMYVSGYGSPHMVVLSRYMRSSVVLGIDPEYWAVAFLRKPFTEPLAKTGDGEKRQMLAEYTLVARNPVASTKVVACA
jgi:hypothetical protein